MMVSLDALLTAWSRDEDARLAARPLSEDYAFHTHARAVWVHYRGGDRMLAATVLGSLRDVYGPGCLGEAMKVWADCMALESAAQRQVCGG